MREVETNLIRERNHLIAETRQLAEDKSTFQERLISLKNSSSERLKLLESTWEKERLALEVLYLYYASLFLYFVQFAST